MTITTSTMACALIREQIGRMVADVLAESRTRIDAVDGLTAAAVRAMDRPLIGFSSDMARGERALKRFMYARLYHHPQQVVVAAQARVVVAGLAAAYLGDPAQLPEGWRISLPRGEPGRTRHVGDFIAGMTDRYALARYRALVGPIEIPDGF